MEHRLLSGWDDPKTACHYEDFCRRHNRYQDANAALVRHADLEPGQRVLDLGAGTGLTAESALSFLGPDGRIVCVEPAAAMRAVGESRPLDRRVARCLACPTEPAVFDRILCGAAIWQILPLERTFTRLAGLLAPGGALCFNIPSLYFGEPDEPGGGRDPLLLELPALLCRAGVETRLVRAGLRPRRWAFRLRFTQAAYRDWLKIPVLTGWMLRDLDADERASRIDEAFLRVDPESWRWERWSGWMAWKPLGQKVINAC